MWCLLLATGLGLTAAIDNSLLTNPTVAGVVVDNPDIEKCTKDAIVVTFYFENDFDGEFFTLDKDDAGNKLCLIDSDSVNWDYGASNSIVSVRFNASEGCVITKDHVPVQGACTPTLANKNCTTVGYSLTAYLRFWKPETTEAGRLESVHTKIDRVFNFICLPQTGADEHDANIMVVDVEPENVWEDFTATPECYYCITDIPPSASGPENVTSVCPDDQGSNLSFDDKIFHEVHCEPNDHWDGAYCLEVETCRASAEEVDKIEDLDDTNSIEIIKDDCTLDKKLIGNFTYDGNTWAFAPSHPFHIGHPDPAGGSVTVFFYCQLGYYPSTKTDTCPDQGCDEDAGHRHKRQANPNYKRMTLKNHYAFRKSSFVPHVLV